MNEQTIKTSDESSGSNISADSTVQEGKGVEIQKKKTYEKSDEQQEYIDPSNNTTKVSNEEN